MQDKLAHAKPENILQTQVRLVLNAWRGNITRFLHRVGASVAKLENTPTLAPLQHALAVLLASNVKKLHISQLSARLVSIVGQMPLPANFVKMDLRVCRGRHQRILCTVSVLLDIFVTPNIPLAWPIVELL